MPIFVIKPITDIPEENAELLGHGKIVNNLKNFLESEHMATPLSIAIHGEWGSGKTSIMKTLNSKLSAGKIQRIFFEPWRYENGDPAMALAYQIANRVDHSDKKQLAIDLILTAANSISKKFLGIEIKDMIPYLKANADAVESFSKKLEHAIDDNMKHEKLLIIIDDLDRCDVENTLLILSIMKLFLSVKNCICIAAVDFKRLRQAWLVKYGFKSGNALDDEGREYLEKIFQIRIGIPLPTEDEMNEYIKKLTPQMPEKLRNMFSKLAKKNPREIKRLLNLIAYRGMLLNDDNANTIASLWTLLEQLSSNDKLIRMVDLWNKNGTQLGDVISSYDSTVDPTSKILDRSATEDLKKELLVFTSTNFHYFLSASKEIATELGINKDVLNQNFQILYKATNETIHFH